MTFDEAMGRRSRAQEVRESEQNFLREFTTMMKTGLTVVMRRDDALFPVHLLLVSNLIEWHYRLDDQPKSGRMPLEDVAAVHAAPHNALVIVTDNQQILLHADSRDIASLLVDGFAMVLRKFKKKRAIKNRPKSLSALKDSNDSSN